MQETSQKVKAIAEKKRLLQSSMGAMMSAQTTLVVAGWNGVDGREWYVTSEILDIWEWMRLWIGEEELGAADDFIHSNDMEHFTFCFPPVPRTYGWVEYVRSFIKLKLSADPKHLSKVSLGVLMSQNKRGRGPSTLAFVCSSCRNHFQMFCDSSKQHSLSPYPFDGRSPSMFSLGHDSH